MRSTRAGSGDGSPDPNLPHPPPGYKRTEIGVLPDDWDVVTIGDIAKIENGATPNTQASEYWGGPIPWCTPTDITESRGKYLRNTQRTLTRAGLDSCTASLLPAGSLLLCSRATIGAVKIATFPVSTNQGFKSLVCNDDVDNQYLYYLLLTLKKEMLGRASGSTFLEISKRSLASLKLPLPPLSEQRDIADALSSADSMFKTLTDLIAKKQGILRAAKQQLLTAQVRLPGFTTPWRRFRLDELGSFTKGRGIRRKDVCEEGVPCIRYGELYTHYDNYILRPISRVSQQVAQTALPISSGDLLFAGSGETAGEIGKCAAYIGDQPAVAGGDIVVLRNSDHDPVFLGHLMNSRPVAKQKARLGQGNAVVHIYARHLSQIETKLPQLEEQQAIAKVLMDMDTEITALENERKKIAAIKKGMMQELLTGRTRLDSFTPELAIAT